MFKKKNAPLVIGFAIPILVILFVVASIYIPGLFLHPKYSFLYTTDENYYNDQSYSVNNGRLIVVPQPSPAYPTYRSYTTPQLYIHNVSTNESMPVALQNAQNLTLDPADVSPDGYKIENGNQGDGFFPFFWYDNNYNAEYLVGHNTSKKLNIVNNGSTYSDSFHFLGWIIQ